MDDAKQVAIGGGTLVCVGQGSQQINAIADLCESKVGEALHVIRGAGKWLVRVAAIQNKLLMVAAQQMPAIGVLAGDDEFKAFSRPGPAIDYIAANHHAVRRPCIDMGDHGLERGQIAVDVGKYSHFHEEDYTEWQPAVSMK